MLSISPLSLPQKQLYQYLIGSISPRPIALVSTISNKGIVNLAPFSYFNVFSVHPPILIFSPTLSGKDGSSKHTLLNTLETKQAVVNVVTFAMVEQMSITSADFLKDTNEFVKSGFTEQASVKVKPPRVAESPIQFECVINEVVPLGNTSGSGNLIIAEIVMFHIAEYLLMDDGSINQELLDTVARMGGNFYCRANGNALFEVQKPLGNNCIGFDGLPEFVKNSSVLTGNNLGQLANVSTLPSKTEIMKMKEETQIISILQEPNPQQKQVALHKLAQKLLHNNQVKQAWEVLLVSSII